MPNFPSSPDDGTIFELESGLFYIYDSAMNSWSKLEGDLELHIATARTAGLMSHQDWFKLQTAVLPPIHNELTVGDVTFDTGIIKIVGGVQDDINEQFVHVDGTADLMNKIDDELTVETINRNTSFQTSSFDFYIDVEKLQTYLVESGKLKFVDRPGRDGVRGKQGRKGVDRLHRGPDGQQGTKGTNAVTPLTLSIDSSSLRSIAEEYQAIVDVATEELSPDENYLVVTKASIGNPDASPNTVNIGNSGQSSWVVVVPTNLVELTSQKRKNRDKCTYYSGPAYYMDVEPILASIRNEFLIEVNSLKNGYEKVVSWWISLMSALFDDQKAAICCALEYCKSQTRNAETRRYLEQSRLQAAGYHGTVLVDPNPLNSDHCDLSKTVMHPACGTGFGKNSRDNLPNNAAPVAAPGCVPTLTRVNGTAQRYKSCPPGFTPRSVVYQVVAARSVTPPTAVLPLSVSVPVQPPAAPVDFAVASVDEPEVIDLYDADVASRSIIHQIRAMAEPDIKLNSAIEIHLESSTSVDIDIDLIDSYGIKSTLAKRRFGTRSGGVLVRYNVELEAGNYTLELNNRGSNVDSFTLTVATQNGIFKAGPNFTINDAELKLSHYELALGTHATYSGEFLRGATANVGLSVPEGLQPIEPYSFACGAIGPLLSSIDNRICVEPASSLGDPLQREGYKTGHGGYIQNWATSKCEDRPLPDSILFEISSSTIEHKALLCRIGGGNFSGGFNHGDRSVQVILEQVDSISIGKISPQNPWSVGTVNDDGQIGSNKFRLTMLVWDHPNCNGPASRHGYQTINVNCQDFAATGVLEIEWETINYKITATPNSYAAVIDSASKSILSLAINSGTGPVVATELGAGDYTVFISKCCVEQDGVAYGQIELSYNDSTGRARKTTPHYGDLTSAEAAKVYAGVSVNIHHTGGTIEAILVGVKGNLDGQILLDFTPASASSEPTVTEDRVLDCSMHYSQLAALGNVWKAGDCKSLIAEVYGQEYIVVASDKLRDFSCLNADTAVAWPTLDGMTLAGVPKSGMVGFKFNKELSDVVIKDAKAGRYISAIGTIADIKTVLFPVA